MITELLTVAGGGTALGIIREFIRFGHDNRKLDLQRQMINEQNADKVFNAMNDRPIFSVSLFLLVSTLCASIILCLIDPEKTLVTFGNTSGQKSLSFLFFSWEWPSSEVYEITTGGVANTLLYILVFKVCELLGTRR